MRARGEPEKRTRDNDPVNTYDVIVIGGGPAGLSAALMLGRCRRRVLVCDAGHPRNAASRALHGYLTRDGIDPREFLRLGRGELGQYGIQFRHVLVVEACRVDSQFEVTLEDGAVLRCRKLLLATGLVDKLPHVEGLRECYGRSAFHCPYCDAWEVRDQPLAVYGRGSAGVGAAIGLKTWSDDVTLCTDGAKLKEIDRELLARYGIPVAERRIARLEHDHGYLRLVAFTEGTPLERRALFFVTKQDHQSSLVMQMGCTLTRKGVVKTGNLGETSTTGVYVVGDASRDVQLAIVAAAEGVKAAFAINKALQSDTKAQVTREVETALSREPSRTHPK
jgi:thioredoxin reductase